MNDFSNISADDNTSVDKNYSSKKENFDAANYNVPNVPIYSQQLFPDFVEDRYGDLSLFTTSYFISVQIISGQRRIIVPLWKVRLMT